MGKIKAGIAEENGIQVSLGVYSQEEETIWESVMNIIKNKLDDNNCI